MKGAKFGFCTNAKFEAIFEINSAEAIPSGKTTSTSQTSVEVGYALRALIPWHTRASGEQAGTAVLTPTLQPHRTSAYTYSTSVRVQQESVHIK
jgi:hypothetical protein